MTEQEWLAISDPTPMLEYLREKASDRKLRLWACGCCYRAWKWLEPHAHKAVEVAERYADFPGAAHDLATCRAEVEERTYLEGGEPVYDPAFYACGEPIADDARGASFYSASTVASELTEEGANFDDRFAGVLTHEDAAHSHLLRDIFGNPFRPTAVHPSWLTSTVISLATGIYVEKAFDRLPILADALQDAGCDNADILNHCRQHGDHTKGCWVIDLLLGKE